MMVKICGITNREDALAAAEYGAGAIGLNFYRNSPRYISPTGAATITAKLPSDVLKVGVFVDDSAETVARVALQVGLDVAQLHGIAACASLPVWRAISIRDEVETAGLLDQTAEAFLLDTAADPGAYGGTGRTFRWELARKAKDFTTRNIIVAGGLDESNVQTAIEEAQPWGVDVCSRIETEPGRKDRIKMKKFIEAALAANL